MEHIKSPVIESQSYYPFGLMFNHYQRENSTKNRCLYNQRAGDKKFNTDCVVELDLNVDQKRTKVMKDKFDLMLQKYREVVATDSIRARAYIMKLDYKDNFYLLKCIAQTYLDESRFVDGSDKMRKEINSRKWRMAEKYIIKAFSMSDDHAETLYTMGDVRKSNYQNDIAEYCFKRIIKLGVNVVSRQEYSSGRSFAKELINDARFELYRLFFQSYPKKSAKYLKEYKTNVREGVETIFKPLDKFLLYR